MKSDLNDAFIDSSPLFGGNASYVEAYYEQFLQNPDSVEPSWREYFKSLNGDGRAADIAHGPIRDSFVDLQPPASQGPSRGMSTQAAQKQAGVLQLIHYYRTRGHRIADLDPLGLYQPAPLPYLEPTYHGLAESDMDKTFNTGSLHAHGDEMTLRDIISVCQRVYTGTVGSEYMYITGPEQKRWIQRRLEAGVEHTGLGANEKLEILRQLTAAEGIERYLHTKFVGQKRFSLEGADSLIPALDEVVRTAARQHVDEIVIGMAHRGRLNVLVNILGKSPEELFAEFEGKYEPSEVDMSGDVKYHLGFSTDIEVENGRMHMVLAFNPSHLEAVNPVALGSVRSRQERRHDHYGKSVLPVLIHGDASFSGQGIVMETLQLSKAKGYATGGTVHVVINNQLGFTMQDPITGEMGEIARTSQYCTDIAKMLEAPVFHVNGDDPEEVVFVTRLAMDYRDTFGLDVIIDLVCYRRQGHNEADEPAVTQPLMYQKVRKHPTPRALYAQQLEQAGLINKDHAKKLQDAYRDGLDEGRNIIRATLGMVGNEYTVDWGPYLGGKWSDVVDTSVPIKTLRRLSATLYDELPEDFKLHKRVQRIVDDRRKMAKGAAPIDWGYAEHMAYATLLDDGFDVRLSGQDSGRGTFFHRHAILYDQNTGDQVIPLKKCTGDRTHFRVNDTLLSEAGVLGFEYGYASADPTTLTVWEAQFGDFVNSAQVIIDQFISSGQAKWGRMCGLTLFLPHGYEGQGPEHSSARLERFLQLCAERHMLVCVPSTPAQWFHLLRQQMVRRLRIPLIVMTPKSLLRHPQSVSALEDLSEGRFYFVIDDKDVDAERVQRVVFCSGKVYYDLYQGREERGLEDVAIVRIEQLYPFPAEEYAAALERYPNANEVVWCQEEPENQGAWYQIKHRLQAPLAEHHAMLYSTRPGSATTAAGYHELHVQQQEAVVEGALVGGEPLIEKGTIKPDRHGKKSGARRNK
jgi:2-oxoglutarate dehydrogenase E1 component